MNYHKNSEAIALLSPEEYWVTQENGTERPGTGKLLYNKEPGIYVDIVSGEPLFLSDDKYESGCGWPSFTKPVEASYVIEISDTSHGMIRTEVRSTNGGQFRPCFSDGPKIEVATLHKFGKSSIYTLKGYEAEGYGQFELIGE